MVPNVSKEQTAFIVKDQGVLQTLFDLEDMDCTFIRTSGINNPITLNNKPEDLNPQHQ